MGYTMVLILKKTGFAEWSLLSKDDRLLHKLNNCASRNEAEDRARVWASSWSSVLLVVHE